MGTIDLPFDPWISKSKLKFFLHKLKEDKELDFLIEINLSEVLQQKIYARPSKGRNGEQGKDIVAIENEETGDYCSYIIKRGSLHKNLDGPTGILKQMEDAMRIELEEQRYLEKKRTARVVHNDYEGNRIALKKFEEKRELVEGSIEPSLLLRPIDRWDLYEIANRLFPHGKKLKELEEYSMRLDRMYAAEEIVIDIKENIKSLAINKKSELGKITEFVSKIQKRIQKAEDNFGPFTKPIATKDTG